MKKTKFNEAKPEADKGGLKLGCEEALCQLS